MSRDWRLSDSRNIVPSGPLWKYLSLADGQLPTWQEKLRSLASGQAFCANPRWFNDPFDCLPNILDPDPDQFDDGYAQLVEKMAASLTDYDPGEVAKRMIKAKSELGSDQFAMMSKVSFERTAQKMGIFCLSSRIDSVLMWSHYASNHTGIALCFDISVEPRSGLMPLMKVRYSEDRPKVSYIPSTVAIEFSEALATKAAFWEYEQEWRHISVDGAGKFTSFDPDVVKGVAFGANCSTKSKAEVLSILKERSIRMFTMVPSQGTFAIEIQSI